MLSIEELMKKFGVQSSDDPNYGTFSSPTQAPLDYGASVATQDLTPPDLTNAFDTAVTPDYQTYPSTPQDSFEPTPFPDPFDLTKPLDDLIQNYDEPAAYTPSPTDEEWSKTTGPSAGEPSVELWSDIVAEASRRFGVPESVIKATMDLESGGNPQAQSKPTNYGTAKGLMQIMDFHWKNGENPFDPRTNVMKGAEILRDNFEKWGAWDKAFAAYYGAIDDEGNITDGADVSGVTGSGYVNAVQSRLAKYGGIAKNAIYQGAKGLLKGAQDLASGGYKDVRDSQLTAAGLTTDEAYSACGPAAAAAFMLMYGRKPTIQEAKEAAEAKKLWSEQTGMYGPAAEVQLINALGGKADLENGRNVERIIRDLRNGNTVIVDTPGHYGTISGYNPETGQFYFGTSATDLKGGRAWMTLEEYEALGANGGRIRASIHAVDPTTNNSLVAGDDDYRPMGDASANELGQPDPYDQLLNFQTGTQPQMRDEKPQEQSLWDGLVEKTSGLADAYGSPWSWSSKATEPGMEKLSEPAEMPSTSNGMDPEGFDPTQLEPDGAHTKTLPLDITGDEQGYEKPTGMLARGAQDTSPEMQDMLRQQREADYGQAMQGGLLSPEEKQKALLDAPAWKREFIERTGRKPTWADEINHAGSLLAEAAYNTVTKEPSPDELEEIKANSSEFVQRFIDAHGRLPNLGERLVKWLITDPLVKQMDANRKTMDAISEPSWTKTFSVGADAAASLLPYGEQGMDSVELAYDTAQKAVTQEFDRWMNEDESPEADPRLQAAKLEQMKKIAALNKDKSWYGKAGEIMELGWYSALKSMMTTGMFEANDAGLYEFGKAFSELAKDQKIVIAAHPEWAAHTQGDFDEWSGYLDPGAYARAALSSLPGMAMTWGAGLGVSLATRNASLGAAAQNAVSYAQMAGDVYEDARKAGMSHDQATRLARASGGLQAAIETTPIFHVPMSKAKGFVRGFAQNYIREAINEGIEEVEQTVVENLFAQHYDKERYIFEDAIKSFAAGFGAKFATPMPTGNDTGDDDVEMLRSRVGRNQNPNPELPADQTGSEMAPPETPTAEGPEIPTLLPTEEPAATPEAPVAEAPVAEAPAAEDQPVQSERPDEELDQMIDMVSNLAEAEAASPSEGRRQSTANSILDQMTPGELTVMEAQAVASGNEVAQQWVADARARLPESEPIASPEGRTTPEIPTLDAGSRTATEVPSAPPASSRSLSDIPLFERLRVVQRAAANPENQAAKRAADNVLASLSRQELPRARKIMDDSGNEKGAMWVRSEISKRELGDLNNQYEAFADEPVDDARSEDAPEGSRIDQETGLALDSQGNARVTLLVSNEDAAKLKADAEAGRPIAIPENAEIVRRPSNKDAREGKQYVPVSVNPDDLGRYIVDAAGRGHYSPRRSNTPIVAVNAFNRVGEKSTPTKQAGSNQPHTTQERGGLDFTESQSTADMGGGASFSGQVGITPDSLVQRVAGERYAKTMLEPLQSGLRSLKAALTRVTGGTKPDSDTKLDDSVMAGFAWMPGFLGTNQGMPGRTEASKIKLNLHQILAQAIDIAKMEGVQVWSPEFVGQLAIEIATAYAHEITHDAVDAHDLDMEMTVTDLMETPEYLELQDKIEQQLQGMSPQDRQAWEADLNDLKENKDSGRRTTEQDGPVSESSPAVATDSESDSPTPRSAGEGEQRQSSPEQVGRGPDQSGVEQGVQAGPQPARGSERVPGEVPERSSGEVNEDLYAEVQEAVQGGELGDRVRASALVKAYDVSYDEASAILAKLRSDKVIDKNGRVQSDSRGLAVDLPEDVEQTHKKFGLRSGSTMAEVVDALAKAQQESEDGYAHLSGPELVELIPGDSTAKRSFVRALSLDAIRKVGKIGMKYADWYFDYMEEFQRRVGAGGREFAALNAILSAQTKVEAHTEGAIKFMIAAREYLAEHPNGFTLAGREVEIDANSFVSKVSKGRQAEIRKARKEGKPDPTWPARMIKIDEAVRDFIVWLEKPEYDFPMQSPDKVKTAALLYFMGSVDRDSKVASFGGNFFLAWLGAYDRRTTNDIWQGRILGAPFTSNGTGAKKDRFGNKLVSGPFGNANAYEWASAVQLWVAQEMGVVPSRLQAAIWTVGSMLWPDAKDMADNPKLKLIGEQEYEKKIKEDPDYTFEDAITDANERGFYDLPQVDGHEILANKQLAPLATKLRALIAHTPKAGKSDEAIITAVADTALGDEVSQTRDAEYTGAMEPQAPRITLPSEIVDLLTERGLLDETTGRTPLITQPHQFSVDGDGQVTLSLGQSNRENAAFWAAVFGQALDLDSVSITEAAFDGEEIVALWADAGDLTERDLNQIAKKMAEKGISVAHDGEVLVLTPTVAQTGEQFLEAASNTYDSWFNTLNREAVKKAEEKSAKTGVEMAPMLREELDITRTGIEPLRTMRGYTDRVDNPDYERIIDALWYRNVSKGRSDLLGKILGDDATRPRGIDLDPYGTPLARGESIVDRIRRERELGADNAAAVSRLDDDFGRGYDGPRTGSTSDTDSRALAADDIPTLVPDDAMLQAQAKGKQKIVADLLINRILGREIGKPEPFMTRERKVREAPINKAYNNYRGAVKRRLKAGREDMPAAPQRIAQWADQIQAEVRAEMEAQRADNTQEEKMGKPASNFLGVQSAADVRRLIEEDLNGLVPTRTIKNILKKRDPYLQGVIDFMLAQRQKVLQGNIKIRDLAKAYYMTVASQGTGWMDVDTFEERMAALGHPMSIRELGIQAGGDPLLFIETIDKPIEKGRGKTRRTEIITEYKVRPEEAAAAWLFSDTGQTALNKLEEGNFDYDAWFQGAKVRMAYGDDRFLSNNVLGEEGVDLTLKAVNLQTLPQLVERINGRIDAEARTGRNVDEQKVSEILDQEIPRLSGISTGKTGFVKQLFGFGDVPTLDAVALNAWVTGNGRVDFNAQTSNRRQAVAAAAKEWISDKGLATWLRNELVKGYEQIRAEKYPGTRSIDPRIFQHIMHHWLWDRAKGDLQTTHKGMMAAESRALAADDITPEMMGEDWNTSISPAEFIALRNRSARSAFMSEISEDDLQGRDLYVLGDEDTGFTGFALQNGDVQNVFAVSGESGAQAKGLGQKSLMKAISEGGVTLDCFDGFLPSYYHQYGFEESGRVAWDDGYAPADWDYDTYGRPDVVLMYRTGWLEGSNANDTIERLRSGKRAYVPNTAASVYPDWDAAEAPRNAALADARRAGTLGSDGEGTGRGLGQGELGADQSPGTGDRGTLDSLDTSSTSDATMQRDSNAARGASRAMEASGQDEVGIGLGEDFWRKEINSRYAGDIGAIAAKELLQNSIDASRDIPGAHTRIDVDLQTRTIVVSDEGTGMTPEIIGKEFTKVGDSKKGSVSSGGFGTAKIAFLGNSDATFIRTVARRPDGTYVETVLIGDSDRYINPAGPKGGMRRAWGAVGDLDPDVYAALPEDMRQEWPMDPSGAPKTGTVISIRVRDDAKFWTGGQRTTSSGHTYYQPPEIQTWLENFNADLRLKNQTVDSFIDGRPVGKSSWMATDTELGSFTYEGTTYRFYASDNVYEREGVELNLLNNGLPQNTMHVKTPQAKLPTRIVLDVETRVPAGERNYPWTVDRRGLVDDHKAEVSKWVETELANRSNMEEMLAYKRALDKAPTIRGTKLRFINNADESSNWDGKGDLRDELVEGWAKEKWAKEIAKAFETAMKVVSEKAPKYRWLQGRETSEPAVWGMGTSKEWLGVNISGPSVGNNANVILFNPFFMIKEAANYSVDEGSTYWEEKPDSVDIKPWWDMHTGEWVFQADLPDGSEIYVTAKHFADGRAIAKSRASRKGYFAWINRMDTWEKPEGTLTFRLTQVRDGYAGRDGTQQFSLRDEQEWMNIGYGNTPEEAVLDGVSRRPDNFGFDITQDQDTQTWEAIDRSTGLVVVSDDNKDMVLYKLGMEILTAGNSSSIGQLDNIVLLDPEIRELDENDNYSLRSFDLENVAPSRRDAPGEKLQGDVKKFVRKLAKIQAKTTIHEWTHQPHRAHDESFAGTFGRLMANVEDDISPIFEKVLTKLEKSGDLWKLYKDAEKVWTPNWLNVEDRFKKVQVDERGSDAGGRRDDTGDADASIPRLGVPESGIGESTVEGSGRPSSLRGRATWRPQRPDNGRGDGTVAARGVPNNVEGIDGIPILNPDYLDNRGRGDGGRGDGGRGDGGRGDGGRGDGGSASDSRALATDDIPQLLTSEDMQRVGPDGNVPGLDRGRWRDEASPAGWKKLFHGTGATSLPMGLRPSKWGEYGAGLYLTDDTEDAGYWALNRATRDNGSAQGANVRPVEVPADFRELTDESNSTALYDDMLRALDRSGQGAAMRASLSREDVADMGALEAYSEIRLAVGDAAAARALENLGYNAIQAPAGEYVVLPRSVRRIRNALSRDARGMVADDVAFEMAGEARVDIPEAEPVVDAVRKAVVQIYRDQQEQLHLDGIETSDPQYARSLNERMLTGQYQQDGVERDNALLGLCAAAADATRYLMELRGMKLTPMVKKRYEADGSSWTHRWLQDSQGRIVDPTADQFTTPEYGWEEREYGEGRAAGFMSQRKDEAGRQMPSQAAEEIADIAAGIMRLRGRHGQSMPSLSDLPEYREMKPSDSRAMAADSDPFPLNNQQHVRGYGYLNTSGLSPEAIKILEEASESARQYPEGVGRKQIMDEAAKRLGLSPKQTRAKWLQADSRTLAREVQVLRNGVMGAMDNVRSSIVNLQETPEGVTQRDQLDALDNLTAATEGTQWLVAGRRAAESIGRALNQYKHVAWASRGRRIVETLRAFTQSTSIAAAAMDKLANGEDLTEQDRRELDATADRLDALAERGYLEEGNDDINALIERMDRGTQERDQQREPESYGERIMRLTQIAEEAALVGDTEVQSRVLGERDEILAFITETVAAQAQARNARPDTAARMTERMLDAIIPESSRGMAAANNGDIDPQILDLARQAMSKARQKKFDAALAGTKDKNDRRRVEKLYKVGEQLIESYVQGQLDEVQLQSVINGLETSPLGQIAADRLYWLVQERLGSQGAQILMGKGGDMTKREYIAERTRIERSVRQNLHDALSAASTQITEESATRARQLINTLAHNPSDAQAQAEFNSFLNEIPSRAIAARLRRSLATQQRLKHEKSVRTQQREQQRALAKELRQIAHTENAALRQQMRAVAQRAGSQASPQLAERYRTLAKQLRRNGDQGQKQADRLNRSLVRGGLLRYLGKKAKDANEDQLTQAMQLLASINPNDPEDVGRLMKTLRNGTPWDRLIEWTYIARLSGLSTWFLTGINMTSNAMATLALLGYRLPAMAVADAVTSPLRGGQRGIHFSDVGAAYNGAAQALKPAMASAWNIWWRGFDPNAVEKAATLGESGGLNNEYLTSWLSEFKLPGGGDLGWLGALFHMLSTRPLQAGDQFFEQLIQTATMHELANAKARRTGSTPLAILGDIGNHLDIIDEMQTRSDYTLLKNRTAWSRAFSMVTDGAGKTKAEQDRAMAARLALTLFMPFVRVPMNVAKQGFEYTAPGALYALARQLPEAVGEYKSATDADARYMAERKQADILAKAMGGFALTAIAILLYAAGAATGDGPEDPDEYANWKLSHEPRSIWNPVTKEWWSYDGLPVAIPFASTINAMERTTDAIAKQREKGQVSVMGVLGTFATVGAWAGVQGYASAIANSTWARGATQALELVSDSNRKGAGDIFSGMAADMTTMLVPNLIANMAGVFDDYERAATTYQEKVMKRLPGLRSMLDVQYDRLGRPEPNVRGGLGKMVIPFPRRTAGRGGPVTDFLDATDLTLSGPPGTVSLEGSSISLKPEERRRYQKYAGEMVNAALTNYTKTPAWLDLQAKLAGKNEAIRIAAEEQFRKELVTPARKAAKDRILGEIFSNPTRREEAIKEMRARRGLDAEE